MVSKISRFKSASVNDWACSIVENVPSSFRTKINFPFLDFFPTSSIGDLKTSIYKYTIQSGSQDIRLVLITEFEKQTSFSLTIASEHLNANFNVSRLCF